MALQTEEELKNGKIVSMEPLKPAAPKPAAKKAAAPKPPAKKAAAKKAPAKKAPAKKAPAKPAPAAKDPVLHLTDTPCDMRGKRADVLKCLKDGMTLGALKTAVAKKFANDASWNNTRTLVVVKAAVAAGFVTIK